MNLISATSSQLLSAVVNSAAMPEHSNEMHRYWQRGDSEPPVDFGETLKAMTSALFPIAASGD